MAPTRTFLTWNEPLLPQAARHLLSGGADLSGALVVLPGARSGRRFLELLVQESKVPIHPPRICTPGSLPELLAPPAYYLSPLTRKFIWMNALKSIEREALAKLVPEPPATDAISSWYPLAEMIDGLDVELEGANLSFEEVISRTGDESSETRWTVLNTLKTMFSERLKALELTDRYEARRSLLGSPLAAPYKRICLIGVSDLNPFTRALLEAVKGSDIETIVHAPAAEAACFDTYGAPAKQWLNRTLDVPASAIYSTGSASDQAAVAAMLINRQVEPGDMNQVTLAATDEEYFPMLAQELSDQQIPSHPAHGASFAETSVGTFIAAVAEYLKNGSMRSFGSLVRHPDLLPLLNAPHLLPALDDYQTEHLQDKTCDAVAMPESLREARTVLGELLAPMQGQRHLGAWTQSLQEMLLAVYSNRTLRRNNRDDQLFTESFTHFQALLSELGTIPQGLQPQAGAADALWLIAHESRGAFLSAPAENEAVEIVGWLELPLDDAPIAVVTGMNEGMVPESLNADPFLPNTLRKELGLIDNETRYCRDAFALTRIMHSRKHCFLTMSARHTNGSYLLPSRLLLACADEELPQRVLRLYQPDATPQRAVVTPEVNGFALPIRPGAITQKHIFSPTEFGDYIQCPYRYYLGHILKLTTSDDQAPELDGSGFGQVLHLVLADFSRSSAARSSNERDIIDALESCLDAVYQKRFGNNALPPVRVQREHMRERLRDFAVWQAEQVRDGWEIIETEKQCTRDLELPSGITVKLRGRIDRIDRNLKDDSIAILDYKTADSGKKPSEIHGRPGNWKSLQLPAYRYLFGPSDVPVQLGYINLSADSGNCAWYAEWTDADLADAWNCMRKVADQILKGDFWPPSEFWGFDPWETLCGSGQFIEGGAAE